MNVRSSAKIVPRHLLAGMFYIPHPPRLTLPNSDVLLRHRRRCHPTPPPRDRSSHSPLPPLRAHPSVPISSSRTSEREASPLRGTRKHARNSEGSSQTEHASTRPRLSPASDDEEEDRYGSRFSRNGMGNGGVFGVSNTYYNGNPVSTTDASYAPHLLPMFQNTNSAFHNMHDPNHLEDASVLLSMAYPGGVPGSNTSPSGSAAQRGSVPEWDASGGATIGMMMDAASTTPTDATTAAAVAAVAAAAVAATSSSSDNDVDASVGANFSSGAVENPARPAAPGAVLPESMGNFMGTMNWLANATNGDNWNANEPPRPLSPFNISNLFPSGTFGLGGLGSPILSNETTAMAIAAAAAAASQQDDAANQNDAVAQANQVVASILEQLAMNDVPETRANPNPERPLLRLASKEILIRGGEECPSNSRFYLPADRFAGCYQIPHWGLPPLRTLSVMAARTYYSVLNHFAFVHEPTFQLIDTAACLAFAICTVGGIRTGQRKGDLPHTFLALGSLNNSNYTSPPSTLSAEAWDGVSTKYAVGSEQEDREDKLRVEEWEGGQIVRHEKTNMLVKSFSLAQGVLMTEYNVALLQALILYHAPYFLSQNDQERRHANMFLGTIVNITRQIGFFQHDLEHVDASIQMPLLPYNRAQLDKAWRRWIQLESRRRTAYLVYHLDTVSALESQFAAIIMPSEIGPVPLPAPDSVWKAATSEDWARAVSNYQPMTLDQAMRRVFNLPTEGRFDELSSIDPTRNILSEAEYGPFARTAIVMTLLRGILDFGEGKRDRNDWRDLTDLWVSATHLRPGAKCLSGEGLDLGAPTPDAIRSRLTLGMQRWREGWDYDTLCTPSNKCTSPSSVASLTPLTIPSPATSCGDNSIKPKGKLVYCEGGCSVTCM